VIARWERCVDCGCRFGLIHLQCHDGVFAVPTRCGLCRPGHKRRLTAARNRKWRQSRRDAESAPTHADPWSKPARKELSDA
jgi:hypothetical protein